MRKNSDYYNEKCVNNDILVYTILRSCSVMKYINTSINKAFSSTLNTFSAFLNMLFLEDFSIEIVKACYLHSRLITTDITNALR